tara:strand:- start:232 stop:369 length:138 start_codon:yes stop_codon:yes gene_type:complete
MYPYKQELLSSLKAFFYAWIIILAPAVTFSYVMHYLNPPELSDKY